MRYGLAAGWLMLVLTLLACKNTSHSNRVVIVQPLGDVRAAQVTTLAAALGKIYKEVLLRPAIALPPGAYYSPRARYRADSLISFLNQYGTADTVVIGLTSKDISTTAHGQHDWGIMGLAFEPGNACVISSFRLSAVQLAAQFYKVAVHELGHTQGLPHCKNKACFMRAAEGGNPLNEETGFCASCKSFLISKGWKL